MTKATTRHPNTTGQPDPAAITKFVERLAAMLVESGMARMPSRVFATLLASDTGQLTAAELAQRLQASPGAISGAVRYLIQVGLAGREREPGTRHDTYRVYDDVWHEAILSRDQVLVRWVTFINEGVTALGDSPAAGRLAETAAFFEFMRDEMPLMMERWNARRARLRANR